MISFNNFRSSRLSKVQAKKIKKANQVFVARGSERGMASLVITVVLISLLSAMAVAFAVIMNRELQKSVNNQIGQAAYNAAASGINDSISYLRDNPNTNVTQCQDLLGPGKPLSLSSDLSGDGSTKYTCVLINTQPPSLVYQTIPANGSQVIQASLSGPASKFMFSWQASSRAYNNFIPPVEGGQLFDETYWKSHKYAPMLKVSLYPVPADTKDASFASANSRTYYLYPVGPTGFSVNTMSYDTPAGTLKPVECGLKNNNGQFNGNGDFDCNLIITNLPSSNPAGYIYYIRLTPLYTAADVEIRANDGTPASGEVNFISTQAIIDVTAQSASAVKRLQARVDISGLNGTSQNISASDNGFPEYVLRSANTICKRLQNPGSLDFPVYLDDYTINYCSSDLGGLTKLKPPLVTANCSQTDDFTTGKCTASVDPNNGTVTACSLDITGTNAASYNCLSRMPSAHSIGPVDASHNFTLGPGSYTYTLCATNAAGPSSPCATGIFTIDSPPPPPSSIGKQGVTVQWSGGSWTADIIDNGDGVGLAQCEFYTSKGGSWIATVNIKDSPPDNNYQMHAGGSVPGEAGYEICYAVDGGFGEWPPAPPPPPPPASINISFFLVEGPYNNGADRSGNYCPVVTPVKWLGFTFPIIYHQYMVCMTWGVTSTANAAPVSCTAYWRNPSGGIGNSSNLLTIRPGATVGGFGWSAGSNKASDLIIGHTGGRGWLTCFGQNGAPPTSVGFNGSTPVDSPGTNEDCHNTGQSNTRCTDGLWYTTPNCDVYAAWRDGKCLQ